MGEMKFFQLSSGQRFEHRGEIYVKAGPLVASHEASGRTQLIMRSAAVRPLDGEAAVERPDRLLSAERVLQAFETYHRGCEACLEQLAVDLDPSLLQVARDGVEEARNRFLQSLLK